MRVQVPLEVLNLIIMSNLYSFKRLKTNLQQDRDALVKEQIKNIQLFQTKLNLLIHKTPTGDLRNELADLGLLFYSINETYENLI